ncbi:MAG: hypothetical protein WEB33_11220 [Bacteroidota bacterium]
MIRVVFLVILIVGTAALGQERETQSGGKRQPSSRPVEVQTPQGQTPLPKINLPEFVITGKASLDPPAVDKEPVDESGLYNRHPLENMPGARDRGTIDLGMRFKQSLFATEEVRSGMILGSLGTFFTPLVMASYGVSSTQHGILGKASYRRTKGFAQFTDASAAALAADGNMVLRSSNEYFDETRLSGGARYDIRKYKFYGSQTPSVQRDWSVVGLNVGASSGIASPLSFHAGLEYRGHTLQDSSATVTENHVTIAAGSELPVFDVPLDVRFVADLATIARATANPLSLFRLTVASPRWVWGDFSMRVAVNGYALEGMNGQKGTYFYPDIRVQHPLSHTHKAFLGFHPSVIFATLREGTSRFPYLSSLAAIRHTVNRLAFSSGIESEWSDRIRTRVSFEFRRSTDEPLYDDSSDSGIGLLAYGGTTTVAGVRVDAVANITPIDYFGIAITARSVRNDLIGAQVPYLPGVEFSASYRHRFPFNVTLTGEIGAYSDRRAAASVARTVPGGFWTGLKAEYDGVERMTLFMNFENVLNRKDQVWRGYRIEPLRADVGISYRW